MSTLPSVLQPLVPIMPLNYAVDGLRQVFIRGAGLDVGGAPARPGRAGRDRGAFFATIASLTIRREVA